MRLSMGTTADSELEMDIDRLTELLVALPFRL